MSKTTLYRCSNSSCPLGTNGQPGGLFTGGRSAEQATLVTGKPAEHLEDGKDYGEGICPSCGRKGTDTGETFKPATDHRDPHQKHHDAIAARVDDPADPLEPDGAQAALTELVEGKSS